MYSFSDIRKLHLEVTTQCNARCPQCPRNLQGGIVNPTLPKAEIRIADIFQLFPDDFVRQLELAQISGSYGDALVARDTADILEYLRIRNPLLDLIFYTNGSGRDRAWWTRLARLRTTCVFGIDGLEDTNHIYRRGTVWEKIMLAAESFIAAGGRAEWMYLIFKHNEHQVEKACALAKSMGFTSFIVKRTGRFLSNGRIRPSYPVHDNDGNVEYVIQPTTIGSLRNEAAEQLSATIRTPDDHTSYLASTPIRCKAIQGKTLYVSAEALVFPCCWTGMLYPRPGEDVRALQIMALLDKLPNGRDSINGLKHPIESIVEGPFFQELIPHTWPVNHPERLLACTTTCGNCDVARDQYCKLF